jgi:hypothetical protein
MWRIPRVRGIGQKGAAELYEVMLTIVIAVCILLVVAMIPSLVGDMASLLTVASAEATARDLAGAITVAGAGQDMVEIVYNSERPQITYDLSVKDRWVNITSIQNEGSVVLGQNSQIRTGWGKTCVDPEGSFSCVNEFTITKERALDCDSSKVCDTFGIEATGNQLCESG